MERAPGPRRTGSSCSSVGRETIACRAEMINALDTMRILRVCQQHKQPKPHAHAVFAEAMCSFIYVEIGIPRARYSFSPSPPSVFHLPTIPNEQTNSARTIRTICSRRPATGSNARARRSVCPTRWAHGTNRTRSTRRTHAAVQMVATVRTPIWRGAAAICTRTMRSRRTQRKYAIAFVWRIIC